MSCSRSRVSTGCTSMAMCLCSRAREASCTCVARTPRLSDRLHRGDCPHDRGVRSVHRAICAREAHRCGGLRERAAQGRCGEGVPGEVCFLRRGVVHRQGPRRRPPCFAPCAESTPRRAKRCPWITRGSAMPNHYCFYLLDEDFGPLCIKFCSYFPYAVKVCLDGHERVKRQPGPRRASPSPPSTTASSGARTRSGCNNCARSWTPRKSRRYCASGSHGCLIPFAPRTGRRVTARPGPSCRPSSRSLRGSTAPKPAGSSLQRSSARASTSAAPTGCSSSSVARSPAAPRAAFAPAWLSEGVVPALHVHSKIKQSHKEGRALRYPRRPSTTPTTSVSAAGCAICPRLAGDRLFRQPASSGRPSSQP
jgi:hypothetical protein